jgi:hypothetical protein
MSATYTCGPNAREAEAVKDGDRDNLCWKYMDLSQIQLTRVAVSYTEATCIQGYELQL